jgi:hypothetical protein
MGSIKSSEKVVSDPDDFRSRSAWTGRSSLTARDLEIPTPRLAEVTLQEIEGLPPKARTGLNAKGMHPGGRLWSYAVEFRY